MKKSLSSFLCICLLITFIACNNSPQHENVNEYLAYCGFYRYVNRSHEDRTGKYDDKAIVKIERETSLSDVEVEKKEEKKRKKALKKAGKKGDPDVDPEPEVDDTETPDTATPSSDQPPPGESSTEPVSRGSSELSHLWACESHRPTCAA